MNEKYMKIHLLLMDFFYCYTANFSLSGSAKFIHGKARTFAFPKPREQSLQIGWWPRQFSCQFNTGQLHIKNSRFHPAVHDGS